MYNRFRDGFWWLLLSLVILFGCDTSYYNIVDDVLSEGDQGYNAYLDDYELRGISPFEMTRTLSESLTDENKIARYFLDKELDIEVKIPYDSEMKVRSYGAQRIVHKEDTLSTFALDPITNKELLLKEIIFLLYGHPDTLQQFQPGESYVIKVVVESIYNQSFNHQVGANKEWRYVYRMFLIKVFDTLQDGTSQRVLEEPTGR